MNAKASSKPGPKGIPAPKVRAASAAATAPASAGDDAAAKPSVEKSGALKLKDLVERVVSATGAKKKDARSVVEATLSQLGDALAKGEELNLPGLGKVRVARAADKDGRAMMTLKVRGVAPGNKKEKKEALAETEEAV